MSLLTNRNRQTDPVKPKKTAAELLKEQDEKQAKEGFKPKLDEKGNRVSTERNGRVFYDYEKIITAPSRPSVPVMQADQTKKTGQKQVGTRYWDDEKKQWKMSMPK